MPSKIVTAHTTAVEVAAERKNAVTIPTSMTIDNDAGVVDHMIRIQDIFTPAETDGTGAPVETTVDRYRIDLLAGEVMVLPEQDLKGVKCLGSLNIIADAVDTDCHVTVGYKHE